ncbi:uncharacterized protein PHACADRAFT_248812 [Phanerochaete carnosa HHB-10118-sp]|uniref:F-box domain-containing protein n=1 Tax=Phanerochaete carnosa (strain HHB-10118-sp) TaxID=650164 RepID=K5WI06_PHACS|nr:uncharacterized protein PHACADRAFT_248812 [Phanerochaete carnosa HHB-10118-sp]EKM58749.1 hypothetical protein PHACADRAFT_248812 [Phanerochaete carnosa HHB-10118-sp]
MYVELGLYDCLVLAAIIFYSSLKWLHDVKHVARSYHEDGPWSPFEDLKVSQQTTPHIPEDPQATRNSEISSPASSPPSSQPARSSVVEVISDTDPSYSVPSSRSSSRHSTFNNHEVAEVPVSTFSERILTNDLLYDLILWFSTPSALMRLSRTCHAAHAAVRSHITRSFNINAHLSHFFTSPLAFRSLQARTSALISGSSALQFLDRVHYPEADLDIYCAYEARAELGWWLIQHEGYNFKPNSRQDPSFRVALEQARVPGTAPPGSPYSRLRAVSAVYTFTRRVESLDGPSRRLKVQIIVAYNSPMEAIFDFHSTVVLNVISFSHAYSLYPLATFHHRLSLSLVPARQLEAAVQRKYTFRGWTFVHSVPTPPPEHGTTDEIVLRLFRPRECAECPHCTRQRELERSVAQAFPVGLRWIGDRHSWVLPLNTEGVEVPTVLGDGVSPPISHDPCFVTSWEMTKRVGRDGTAGRAIKAKVRRPPGFWHCYVVSDPKLKKAMKMIQELYVDIPERANEDPKCCDGEFIRYCKAVLEDEKMWNKWYPSARSVPEIEL